MTITADLAFVWTLRISALCTVLGGLEQLARPAPLRDDGLMSWAVGSLRHPALVRGRLGAGLDALLRYPNVLWLTAARVSVAVVIALGPATLIVSPAVLGAMCLLVGLHVVRNPYGQDGSDQMQWIIFLGAAATSMVGTPAAKTIFLWFVALQACLAYATAGFAKLVAPGWRDGRFLAAIMGTAIYGHPRLGETLSERRRLSKGLSLAIIGWECAFALVLVAPPSVAWALLVAGVAFHLANAYLMGLNLFFWAFLATYPALAHLANLRLPRL